MTCTLNCRIVLNPVFRPLLNTNRQRFTKLKREYRVILRECVIRLFSRVDYPHNVNIDNSALLEYHILSASASDTSVLIKCVVNLSKNMEKEEIENDVLSLNLRTEFVRNVRVINIVTTD